VTRIEIVYNPYRETSRILADGLPVSEHGELARYQSEPFSSWCAEILDAVARQVNDAYTLTFTAPLIEREIITALGKGHPDCQRVEAKPFAVNIPPEKRFEALFGTRNRRAVFSVYLMTPPGRESLRGEVKAFTEPGSSGARILRSGYENAEIRLFLGLPPPGSDPENTLCCWLSADFQEEHLIPHEAFLHGMSASVLSVAFGGGQRTGFDHLRGNLYSYRCEPGKLDKLLTRFLEYACIIPFFKRQAAAGLPSNLVWTGAIEPIVQVSGPPKLEAGRSERISISIYPKGSALPPITYRTIPEGIVTCSGGTVHALSAGDATVEAYISGSPEPCGSFPVRVYRRNRIKSILINEQGIEIPMGRATELQYSFSPADADNTAALEWRCSPSICQITGGGAGRLLLKGLRTGDAEITVSAEGVSASVSVRVRPVVTRIILSAEHIRLRVGQDAELTYRYSPADAVSPGITAAITDPTVVTYQNGRVLPRRVGETDIVFTNAASGVRAVCKVEVGVSSGERGGILDKLLNRR
jgi:hypothetical protein